MSADPGNLAGIRVLDRTGECGYLAGKLLAELGAEVIKVEPRTGDPARHRGPFVGGPDPERSLPFLAQNTSKRGITLDLAHPGAQPVWEALVRNCQVLLESVGDEDARQVGPSPATDEEILAWNPELVICRISPFGRGGPYATRRGSDLTVVALGGNLYPTGNPDRAPVRCTLPVSHFHGAIEAAVAVTFALWGVATQGRGQVVDVSLQECMVMPNMTTPMQFPFTGFTGKRVGGGFRGARAFFRELWPCKDGYVSFALRGGPARIPGIKALVRYMEQCGMAPPALRERNWDEYNHNLVTQEEVDEIEAALAAFFATQTMQELFDAACERSLLLAPANTAREIVASRQLAAREFFVRLEDPQRGLTLLYPGAFARNSLGSIRLRGPAPTLGQHNEEIYRALGFDGERLAREGVI